MIRGISDARVNNPSTKRIEQMNSENTARVKLGTVPIPRGSAKVISPDENSLLSFGSP